MEIVPQPLTQEAFAPFGDVIDVPQQAGRTYYEDALGNLRPRAKASLSMTFRVPTSDRPLKSELMERHEFSSQTFVPVDVARWLIVVAPHAPKGGPDVGRRPTAVGGRGRRGRRAAPPRNRPSGG